MGAHGASVDGRRGTMTCVKSEVIHRNQKIRGLEGCDKEHDVHSKNNGEICQF